MLGDESPSGEQREVVFEVGRDGQGKGVVYFVRACNSGRADGGVVVLGLQLRRLQLGGS